MARSANASGWLRATPEQCERLQRALWEAKTEVLARVPRGRLLTLPYEALLADPGGEVRRIARHLALPVRQGQLDRAAAIVAPRGQQSGLLAPEPT